MNPKRNIESRVDRIENYIWPNGPDGGEGPSLFDKINMGIESTKEHLEALKMQVIQLARAIQENQSIIARAQIDNRVIEDLKNNIGTLQAQMETIDDRLEKIEKAFLRRHMQR